MSKVPLSAYQQKSILMKMNVMCCLKVEISLRGKIKAWYFAAGFFAQPVWIL